MFAKPDERLIQVRMPVWRVLSELFLDTTLDAADHRRIARVLSASPYGVEELEDILIHEIYPVCRNNALSVAGEWAGFDDDWLLERITPYLDKRVWWRRWPLHRWIYRDDWWVVRDALMTGQPRAGDKPSI